jgi:tetratricopeptide (TPR) repeat protein
VEKRPDSARPAEKATPRIVDANPPGRSAPGAPRVRSHRADEIAKANRPSAEVAQRVLTGIATAKSPSAASRAFVSGLFLGGAATAGHLGTSFGISGGFSWYNYLNYGGGACSPWWYYHNCHSVLSFFVGFNSSFSTWGLGFYYGSPWWWTGPVNYCASYWNSYYCNPWYAFPGTYYNPWHYYHPSLFYSSYYNPAYYYPTYYPAYYIPYYAPEVVHTTEVIYYPVVQETTVYADAPAGERREPRADSGAAPPPVAPLVGAVKPRAAAPAPTGGAGLQPDSESSPTALLADRYVGLGDIYFKLGHFEKAEDSYRRALHYDSKEANLHFIMADALFANGKYAQASSEILNAIQIDPSLVESRADKRDFYGSAAEFNLHLRNLENWLTDHPSDGSAWLVLAYNYYFSNQLPLARDAFARAMELSAGMPRRGAELFLAAVEVRLAELRNASKPASLPTTEK